MNYTITAAIILVVTGGALYFTGYGRDLMSLAHITLKDDKLGWLDDAEFTDRDRARVAIITGQSYNSNLGTIQAIQGGYSKGLTRNDFELLRQDLRRAQAAYPDIKPEQLFASSWFSVDMSDRVPMDFGGYNSQGTQGSDGKWYLDGGCYKSYTKPEFPKRASAAVTKQFFIDKKIKDRQVHLERLKTEGPFVMWGGTGGSMSVRYDKKKNVVTVERTEEWANKGKRWIIPFVVEDWVDVEPSSLDAIKAMPSFSRAKEEDFGTTPTGVTITSGGGTIQPGESVEISTPILMHHQ